MKYWRIFWTCHLFEGKDGYYYHRWFNFIWYIERDIFAGYNSRALRSKKSTFKDVKLWEQ